MEEWKERNISCEREKDKQMDNFLFFYRKQAFTSNHGEGKINKLKNYVKIITVENHQHSPHWQDDHNDSFLMHMPTEEKRRIGTEYEHFEKVQRS